MRQEKCCSSLLASGCWHRDSRGTGLQVLTGACSLGLAYVCEGLKEQRKGLITLVLWNNQLTHTGMAYLGMTLVSGTNGVGMALLTEQPAAELGWEGGGCKLAHLLSPLSGVWTQTSGVPESRNWRSAMGRAEQV